MAALEPYRFETERVPDENQASDDNNDESERLNNLNWYSCGRCELRETLRECILCLEEPNRKTSLRKVFYELCTFLPFNLHATRNQLSNLRLALKAPLGIELARI